MLDLIRKKQKSVFIKIAFAVIIVSFVIGYAMLTSPGDRSDGGTTVAVTVNKTKIGFEEYQRAYSNLYRLYQNIYREQFTPALEKQLRLRQQALDALIEETLLLQEAKQSGVKVSQKELVESIAEIPAFQDNGAFSKQRYLELLAYQRLTTDDFEAMQKRQLLVEKVRENLRSGVAVTEEDIEREFRDQNEKVNLAFLRLAPTIFESRVEVAAEDLEAFFSERREEFRIPETVALRYLQFEPARYEKELTFTEEELQKYYRRHLDRFEILEQTQAAHVLIKVDPDADEDTRTKKRELAEQILDEARAGKDFGELARTYSDDAGSAVQGGDLGYFPRGTMVAPFEKAAFALKPGEISDVVESSFGYHVIKSQGYIEAGVKPLADVLDTVKEGLAKEKSRQLAMEKAMDAYNMNRKNGDLDAAAEANDLGVKETGFFSRDESIDGIGSAPEIAAAAFLLKPGELARPISRPEGVFLVTVKERRESRLPELQEVRAAVEEAFRRENGRELARQTAEKVLAGLKEGKELQELARDEGETVEETGFFARSYGAFVPRIGSAEALAAAAFELAGEAPVADEVFTVDGKYVVAMLRGRQEADMEALDDAKRAELRESLTARKQEDAINSKVQQLKAQAEIVIAPSILTTLESE